MRRILKLSLTAVALLLCLGVQAKVVKGYRCASEGSIAFVIDSIDFRPDLCRVYGKLKGQPHTSNRIDNMTVTLPGSQARTWTDVEGVDMKRWFQWEDNGLINVEIDFPPLKSKAALLTMSLDGPKGPSKWTVTRGTPKAKKARRK